MNVLAVGLTAMAVYLIAMAVWLRYDARLDAAESRHPDGGTGGERR